MPSWVTSVALGPLNCESNGTIEERTEDAFTVPARELVRLFSRSTRCTAWL